ncbi:uncharacterized protein C19orf47 homolog isoform X2 [Petaurus breviceps papuanus]|uniref:uncharacterized protein C19orf47 homolog isoform X2 n=1 Tax=Petaurus breviceps papuanus TaxID=3040969 RepID=UPI0036D775D3
MVSVTMATSEWIQFFKEAGIPPGPAVNYAVMFVDNRIQKNMLLDLNKEIMNELGVTVVGDIIAILKHAKVVYRQDVCKAAAESLASSPSHLQAELRRSATSALQSFEGVKSGSPSSGLPLPCSPGFDGPSPACESRFPSVTSPAASRMIANSLSRDSPPSTPARRPDASASKISVTVSNKMAAKHAKAAALDQLEEENADVPVKRRRRVTAEMEGKYIITMPKGTTPRTRKILEQQAAKGVQRTSVFDRLGAETKADTTTGNKPTGVFSRLGDALETDEERAGDSDDDNSVLQYAGVLKRMGKPFTKDSSPLGVTVKAKATSSEPQLVPATLRRLGSSRGPSAERKPEALPKVSVIQRLGKAAIPPEAQDSQVTSTKSKSPAEFKVTIKRTLAGPRVSSSSEGHSAQMDNTGTVSVFKRLGRKTD